MLYIANTFHSHNLVLQNFIKILAIFIFLYSVCQALAKLSQTNCLNRVLSVFVFAVTQMWWCSSSVPENNHMHRWITEREAETGRRDWNGSKYLEGTLSWWIAKRWYLDVLGDAAFSHFCFVGLFLLLLFYFCSCFWYVCWPKFNVWLNDWMIHCTGTHTNTLFTRYLYVDHVGIFLNLIVNCPYVSAAHCDGKLPQLLQLPSHNANSNQWPATVAVATRQLPT